MDNLGTDKDKDLDIKEENKKLNDINEKENDIINKENNLSNKNLNEKLIYNSISKSFESEQNDKQENINNEEINNNIIQTEEYKNKAQQKEEENLNNNIEDKKDKEEPENKKKEKKTKEKNKSEFIVREPNKKPVLGPLLKSQLKPSINKIKNKSIEKTIKTLLNSDENNNQSEEKNINKNKFIDKLRDFKRELSEKEEMNKYIKKKNIFEFTFKNYEDSKNNRYKNTNKDSDLFNFNVKDSLKDNKYKELKEKYFNSNKNEFSPNDKKVDYKLHIFMEKEKPITSYKQSPQKKFIDNYNYRSLSKKPLIYRKNSPKIRKNLRNNDIFRLMNSMGNLGVILNKFKKSNNYEIQKNNVENNKIDYIYIIANKNQYKNNYNNKNKIFNSSIFENSKKLQNLMNDVFHEIKQNNKKSSSKKYEFKSRLLNIKSKITSQSVNRYNKKSFRKNQLNVHRYTPKKSSNLNFDELLNLCSKENLKSYYTNSRKN